MFGRFYGFRVIRRLDHKESAQNFLRFAERSIRHGNFSALRTQLAPAIIRQLFSGTHFIALDQAFPPRDIAAQDFLISLGDKLRNLVGV